MRTVSRRLLIALALACAVAPIRFGAAAPIRYRFTFPEPQHRWMQVEASFPDLDTRPLELRMSRASPGRYSLHDFAKNVYDVQAAGTGGRELKTTRPDPYGWTVMDHPGSVTVKYKVFGDRVDGTYLGIDTTHAHINMPAVIMWARGLDERPIAVTFAQPAGMQWRVATQLHEAQGEHGNRSHDDAQGSIRNEYEFTAPNLQYLMDSPTEFGPILVRQFSIGPRLFRLSLHHTGTGGEVDGFVEDVEKIVRQEGAVYGEFPEFEPGSYTFLADYLPSASGDGMEHRNSTVMTSAATIGNDRLRLLGTVAHEFFHGWNVERIRPRSLEPFDFERANLSGELWLAEGFTEYYGSLVLHRAGLTDLAEAARTFGGLVDTVETSAARLVRSAVEMSEMAAFIDGGRPVDRTNWSTSVISYYTFGGAIALALDLTLRDRSDNRVTLDDYMRAMWRVHGKPGGHREGYVDRPYTLADAEARLAEVSGDRAFARDFFARFIDGHEAADYGRLLLRAGLRLRKRNAGRPWWGDLRLDAPGGHLRVENLVSSTSPAYAAGLELDDTVDQIDGERVSSPDQVNAIVARHKPGDRLQVTFVDRSGVARTARVALIEDPHVEVVPLEATGGSLNEAQRTFRDRWLKSQQ